LRQHDKASRQQSEVTKQDNKTKGSKERSRKEKKKKVKKGEEKNIDT
jgi:hypothetical protein